MTDATVMTFDETTDGRREPVEETATATDGGTKTADGHSHRHLIIRVTENGQSRTNIRIPLKLAQVGMKFMPAKEKENLKQQGIDIEELLGELTGDEEGPLVQVDEEGKSVFISVE